MIFKVFESSVSIFDKSKMIIIRLLHMYVYCWVYWFRFSESVLSLNFEFPNVNGVSSVTHIFHWNIFPKPKCFLIIRSLIWYVHSAPSAMLLDGFVDFVKHLQMIFRRILNEISIIRMRWAKKTVLFFADVFVCIKQSNSIADITTTYCAQHDDYDYNDVMQTCVY